MSPVSTQLVAEFYKESLLNLTIEHAAGPTWSCAGCLLLCRCRKRERGRNAQTDTCYGQVCFFLVAAGLFMILK